MAYIDVALNEPAGQVVNSQTLPVASVRERLAARVATVFEHLTAFSPDGTRVVTASNDQTARVWDAATASVKLAAARCARE